MGVCVCVRARVSSCNTERRLAQPDNVDVLVLTAPDKIQCKPASLIAAGSLGCCPFVTYILCVCVCVCVYPHASECIFFRKAPIGVGHALSCLMPN
jgi:hypothetical protein